MGQNIRAVEQVITNLQNQRIIFPDQAQKFMSDFENNSSNIKDAKQFIDDPTLTKFLKYYINYKYKTKIKPKKGNKLVNQTVSSRAQIQNELMQVAEIQLKDKIVKNLKKVQERMHTSLKKICNVVIEQNYDLFKQIAKQLIIQNMKIEQFCITWSFDNQYVVFESAIDYIQYVNEGDTDYRKYQQLFKQYKNKGQDKIIFNLDQKNNRKVTISYMNESHHYIFQFIVKEQVEIQTYKHFKNNEHFMDKITAMIIGLATQYEHSCNYKSHLKNLSDFCMLGLCIIQLGAYLGEESIRQDLMGIIGKNNSHGQQVEDLTIFDIYKQIVQPYKSDNSSPICSQLQKSYDRYSKELNNIKSYFSNVRQQIIFIDFDRYSQLKFCFINSNWKKMNKIKSCWRQDRIKIIDIMSEENKFLNHLREVTKNEKKSSVISEDYQEFYAKIHVGNNSVIDKISIFFEQKNKQNKQNDEQFEISELDILKQNKNSTSLFQQRLVKDLQKQDPNLKKTGWLKLFVQQYIDSTQNKNLKAPVKWSVTDIQKVEGIDDINLNVLTLNSKELKNLIWSIMKTNQTFNSYVHDEQTLAKFDSFLNQLQYHYNLNKNKYHIFHHGVNVLHMCYIIVSNSKIQEYLSNIEIFSILLSGLCHDVGHSGFSNSYQIQTFSDKAMTYNDISPLENYQASKTFQILKNSKNNFLHKMEREKFMMLKQNVIHNILNTDMKQHFNLISKFKEWMNLPKDQAVAQSNTLTAMIVRAGAFGCSCKQFSITKQWSYKLNLELINQNQNEKKFGIQSKESLVNLKSLKTWSSNQLGYLKVIVLPIYQEISLFCPTNSCLKSAIASINTNIQEWKKIHEKQSQN